MNPISVQLSLEAEILATTKKQPKNNKPPDADRSFKSQMVLKILIVVVNHSIIERFHGYNGVLGHNGS